MQLQNKPTQTRRKIKVVSKKLVTCLILTSFAIIYLDLLQPDFLRRILTLEQKVDLSKFQIDTYPLIDVEIPSDEEISNKVKEIKGEVDNQDFDEEAARIPIDQMFYMNLDEDIEKRQKMQDWLSWFLPNRGIPFYRVPLMKGLPYVCAFEDDEKCIKESGKVDTLLHLMQSNEYKTSGTSLVLQDDIEVTHMHRLRFAANLVPDDWDVIRFDCPLENDNTLPNLNKYVFQMNQGRDIKPFVDNSRVMLLRNEKFDKVAEAINVLPRRELDAALSYEGIKSYCVNVGIGHRFEIKKPRPVIYTFFSPLHEKDRHDYMVDLWKKEWELAGFDPRILTIEDAMKNPYFETMKVEVEQVFKTDVYNAYCFYRYLAMATVGGIMSDYDTMPVYFPIEEAMSDTLVNDGKFTSFEAHVPSLISASKEEWQHVAELLTEQIPKSKSWLKSDMYLLQELGQDPSNDVDLRLAARIAPRTHILTSIPYTKGEKQKVNCHLLKNRRAIHMSHSSMSNLKKWGLTPDYDKTGLHPTQHRAKLAETFMNDFREQCMDRETFKEIE